MKFEELEKDIEEDERVIYKSYITDDLTGNTLLLILSPIAAVPAILISWKAYIFSTIVALAILSLINEFVKSGSEDVLIVTDKKFMIKKRSYRPFKKRISNYYMLRDKIENIESLENNNYKIDYKEYEDKVVEVRSKKDLREFLSATHH